MAEFDAKFARERREEAFSWLHTEGATSWEPTDVEGMEHTLSWLAALWLSFKLFAWAGSFKGMAALATAHWGWKTVVSFFLAVPVYHFVRVSMPRSGSVCQSQAQNVHLLLTHCKDRPLTHCEGRLPPPSCSRLCTLLVLWPSSCWIWQLSLRSCSGSLARHGAASPHQLRRT